MVQVLRKAGLPGIMCMIITSGVHLPVAGESFAAGKLMQSLQLDTRRDEYSKVLNMRSEPSLAGEKKATYPMNNVSANTLDGRRSSVQQAGDVRESQMLPYNFMEEQIPGYNDGQAVVKDCRHRLVTINNSALKAALAHQSITEPDVAERQELVELRSRRIFITGHLYLHGDLIEHWTMELIRLLMALRRVDEHGAVQNIFVSIYESPDTRKSEHYVKALKYHLEFLQVPFGIVRGKQFPGIQGSLDYLIAARNAVLEPLFSGHAVYDNVLMLDSLFFCADGIVQMLLATAPDQQGGVAGADAVCGADFNVRFKEGGYSCIFAGSRASRDMTGQPFRGARPYAGTDTDATSAFIRNEPFQAFSCWNGMVAFNAAIFQKDRLMFRRNRERLQECSASTSELFFRDMWKVGRQKAVILPSAASGRTPQAFLKCALKRQPRRFNQSLDISFSPAPEEVKCCPMAESSGEVKFTKCYEEKWDRFGDKVPRYRSSHLRPALQIDGDMTFLPMRSQRDDTNFDSSNMLTVVLTAGFGLGILVERMRASQENHPMMVPILLCGFSSLAMNTLNKLALSVLPLPFSIAAVQMGIASILLVVLCGGRELLQELQEHRSCFRRWGLLSLPYAAMLATSILVLEQGSVATLVIARSALPIVCLGTEWMLAPNGVVLVTVQTCLALYLIATGTLLYAVHDLKDSQSLVTILTIAAHVAFSVVYRVQQRRLLTDGAMQLSFGAINFVNNVVGLVPVLPLCILYDEHQQWMSVGPRFLGAIAADPGTLGCIALSACAGVSLGYYSLVIQKQMLATSMFVLQSALKIIAVVFAILLSQGQFNRLACLGCLLSLAGSMWYSGVCNLQAPLRHMSGSAFKIA